MSLIHWQPLKELDTLRHQMNHAFDELMHSDREFTQFSKLDNVLWSSAIELKETETDLILKGVLLLKQRWKLQVLTIKEKYFRCEQELTMKAHDVHLTRQRTITGIMLILLTVVGGSA
jgi:hypothetical protein